MGWGGSWGPARGFELESSMLRSVLCPEINPRTYGQLSMTKEAKIYNGEKTVSSISGAGKTGQLHVKE